MRMAQVWEPPAETLAQSVAVPTWVGESRAGLPPPSPWTLPPQHQRVWPVRMAQVSSRPAETLPQSVAVPT